jgi:hypothetical protein
MFQLKNKRIIKTIQSKWNQLEDPDEEWVEFEE